VSDCNAKRAKRLELFEAELDRIHRGLGRARKALEAVAALKDHRAASIRWCECSQPWIPAAGLYGTTEETRCQACVLREMLHRDRDKVAALEEKLEARAKAVDAIAAGIHARIEKLTASLGPDPASRLAQRRALMFQRVHDSLSRCLDLTGKPHSAETSVSAHATISEIADHVREFREFCGEFDRARRFASTFSDPFPGHTDDAPDPTERGQ